MDEERRAGLPWAIKCPLQAESTGKTIRILKALLMKPLQIMLLSIPQ
jgi:hypothetical protein